MAHWRRTKAGRNSPFQQTIARGTGRNPKNWQDPENVGKQKGDGRKEGTQSNEKN